MIESTKMICLWCGKSEGLDKTIEHIFPKSIGGRKTLPIGSVCGACNHQLHFLDTALIRENPAMMDAFQADFGIKGYKRKGKQKEEKSLRRTYFEGEGGAKYTKIKRQESDIFFVNADFNVISANFVRALHKCTSNVLCDH